MKYLKKNSEWQEQQKRVMASDMEAFVPEEFDESLRADFERRCAHGERLNTELMTSAKWVKVLKDIGAIIEPSRSGPNTKSGKGSVTLADADIIFGKVLHNCDHGGKRLTYDLFCKALYLAAKAAQPEMEGEAAMQELVSRVVAAAPHDLLTPPEDEADYTLDPNVLLVLDHFKPALHDLFDTFCTWNLSNMADASRGIGSVRMAERSYWRHSSSGVMGSTSASSIGSPTRRALQESFGRDAGSPMSPLDRKAAVLSTSSEADAGGGCAGGLPEQPDFGLGASPTRHLGDGFTSTLPTLLECEASGSPMRGRSPSPGGMAGSTICSRLGSPTAHPERDPYVYVNGAPVVRDRQRVLSLEQFLSLTRELKIMPEFLSRLEVVRIFKRVQCPGGPIGRSGSAYSHISAEAFVDAVGQLAYLSYSKEPYCDEFPLAHDRIQAFLLRFLPRSSRALHEKFRGRLPHGGDANSPTKAPCRTKDV